MQEFSVKEISQILSSILKNAFPEMIAVTGEISQMSNQNSSGHLYFSLKEDEAVLNATYFKYFQSSGKFIPKIGDKVKVIGEIKSYDRTSSYQINARKIEYDSKGLLWQQFEEMKRKLFTEGLFDEIRKRPIPKYPYKIAILTALNGAVIRDFMVTTKNESGRYLIDVWNIPVQNIENAEIIANTILKAGKHTELYDVIVVMRGGGSVEDLSVFNQEVIARAVSASKVPLISAIGHETDYTVIDYVADYRAATPTAAAVYLSSHYKAAYQSIEKDIFSLGKNIINLLGKKNQQFDMIQLRLANKSPLNMLTKLNHKVTSFNNILGNIVNKELYNIDRLLLRFEGIIAAANPNNLVEAYERRIINSSKSLFVNISSILFKYYQKEILFRNHIKHNVSNKIGKQLSRFEFYHHKLNLFNPVRKLDNYIYRLGMVEKTLLGVMREKYVTLSRQLDDDCKIIEQRVIDYLFEKNADVMLCESKLKLLDPKNVMDRGYAIVTQKNKIISSVDNMDLNEDFSITLKDGVINAYPEKINSSKTATKLQKAQKVLE